MQPITFYVINIRLKCAFFNVHRKYNCKIIMYSAALPVSVGVFCVVTIALWIAVAARRISLCNQIISCSGIFAAVCVGNSFRTGTAGIVKYSTAGIDDISEHICRRLLCRSFFLCRSRRFCRSPVVGSASVVVASVVVVVVVVVVAFVVVVVSVAVVVVTTVVVVVTVLSFLWLLVVWLRQW